MRYMSFDMFMRVEMHLYVRFGVLVQINLSMEHVCTDTDAIHSYLKDST